ncbi:ATP-binding protein [Mycolicibacterium thermoresistibile]
MGDGVVGRVAELHAVADFLTRADGGPSALLIEGELGIGKTTLWKAAVRLARDRGFRVLSARGAPSESALTYAAVADLLGDVDAAAMTGLPDPQQAALDHVLLRGGTAETTTQPRAVGAALLSVVDLLAEQTPVLVAIDDLQWLDASSALVFGFAARRFTSPVGLCCTVRTDHDGYPSTLAGLPDEVVRLRMPPLSLSAVHTMLRARRGRSYPRPTLGRIYQVSGGNPLYALEVARALDEMGNAWEDRLPATLADLVRARVEGLSTGTRQALLAAACLDSPTTSLVARALETTTTEVVRALETAEARGLIGIDGGRIQFGHPLFAHGIYSGVTAARRREMHRRLAAVVEEPEFRARHLAKSATEANPRMLASLDAAAHGARTRGAPAAAAELLDLAIALGGQQPERLIASARNHFDAGDTARARTVVEHAIAILDAGPLRAQALSLLAVIRLSGDGFVEAAELLGRALQDIDERHPLRAQMLVLLSFAQQNCGRLDDATRTADLAVTAAEHLDDPHSLSQALSMRAMLRFIGGAGLDEPSMRRALELEDPQAPHIPVVMRPSAHHALLLAWTGQLDQAATALRSVWRFCDDRGAESDLVFLAVHRVMIEIWRGRPADAALVAEDTMQRAAQLGGDFPLFVALTARAACAAYAGSEDDARRAAHEALAASDRCESKSLQEWTRGTLAFLEVSVGNPVAALAAVQPLLTGLRAAPEATELVPAFYLPDAIEAMLAVGNAAAAEPLIDALQRNGRRLDRPWILAVGARCRAMLLAMRGDVEDACRSAHQAMAEHERLPMPFERARTRLLLGQLQRRHREKEVAAAAIREALAEFERLGAPLWADRARAELARVKVGPRQSTLLTPSEQRVAELAASGMTNRDVAAKLFISPKTVEANLSRAYQKLGIHSRAELGRVIPAS